MRGDQTDVMSSRRSSYYGGGGYGDQNQNQNQNRFSSVSGYVPNRQSVRDSYDGYGQGGPVGGPSQRTRYGNRMQSDPGWNNRQSSHGVYPMNGHQQSRDTVNTNGSNGSHSDGPYYSNDPSSENSSIERAGPVKPPQQDMGEQHGFNGFSRGPIMEEYAQGPPNGGYYNGPPPPAHSGMPLPPPKYVTPPAPIKLNSSGAPPPEMARPNTLSKQNSTTGNGDKRKSWFKRRFSKD
jgi:hypothetical protein